MRTPVFMVTGLLILLLMGCGGDGDEPSNANDEQPHRLAVQNAQTGQLTVQGEEYSLTLEGVADQMVWFTDRPVHRAGTEATGDLLHDLFDSADGPPNAALVWASDDGETTLVLELLNADYDETQGTVVFQARVLDEGDGRLAEFGASSEVPSGEIGTPSLFIDSIFKDEVCELDLYNEVHNPPGVYGYVPKFYVDLLPGDETTRDSGPDDRSSLESGSSFSWKWEASSSIDDCSVNLTLEEESSSSDVISFSLYNPSTGNNEFTVSSCNGFQCSNFLLSNTTTLHAVFIICESGVSDSDCMVRAGYGDVCQLDVYNEVRNSGAVALKVTSSLLQDGTITDSAPSDGGVITNKKSDSWEWAGSSHNVGCSAGITITDEATGNSAVLTLENPDNADNVFHRLACQGFQCAWTIITNSTNVYRVAFVVCESGTGFDACNERAGF